MQTATPSKRNRKLPVQALAAAVLAAAALIAVGSASAGLGPGKVSRLQASCAGDLIRGKAMIKRPGTVTLRLLWRESADSAFIVSRQRKAIHASRAGSYRFKFDVSRLNGYAYAYRVRASGGVKTKLLMAESCGPGLQVPEVPYGLLLPVSLLVALGLPLALRLRRAAVDNP
jgi:hypothetical protein